jgi:hypothetical protein
MDATRDTKWAPLQEAVAAWAQAVEALDAEVYRVTTGGRDDPEVMAQLLNAVEQARFRCEQVSLDIQQIAPGSGDGAPAGRNEDRR